MVGYHAGRTSHLLLSFKFWATYDVPCCRMETSFRHRTRSDCPFVCHCCLFILLYVRDHHLKSITRLLVLPQACVDWESMNDTLSPTFFEGQVRKVYLCNEGHATSFLWSRYASSRDNVSIIICSQPRTSSQQMRSAQLCNYCP